MSEIFFDGMKIAVDVGTVFTDKISVFWCEFIDEESINIQSMTIIQLYV